MGRPITLYVDEATSKLIEKHKDKNINLSNLLQRALNGYFNQLQDLNEEIEKLPPEDFFIEMFRGLPSIDELQDLNEEIEKLPPEDYFIELFKGLPSTDELQDLNEEIEKLPPKDYFDDAFEQLPSAREIEELNDELDKTIEKLERIKKLKSRST